MRFCKCFVSMFMLPWLLTALWCAGGLGEGVAGALSEELNICVHRLAVTGIPRSGLCHELLVRDKLRPHHQGCEEYDLIGGGCPC